MPTLTPDQIRAVFAAGEEVPDTGYTPTSEDIRRAQRRVCWASSVLGAVLPTPSAAHRALRDAESACTVETVRAARDALRALPERSTDGVRLARCLVIDAARMLAGAADAVPV